MTFEEHIENMISDYKILQSFFPEQCTKSQLYSLIFSYFCKQHLINIKKKLEEIFKRDLTWYESDSLSSQIFSKICNEETYDKCMENIITEKTKNRTDKLTNYECLDIKVSTDVHFMQTFSNYIGIKFSEESKKGYKNMLLRSKYIRYSRLFGGI